MACANVNMDIQAAEEPSIAMRRPPSTVHQYEASELLPEDHGPLHHLLQRQPAVLGSLQVMSGLFSVGVGLLFAVTQEMTASLFTMFRVSHLTGVLFIIAGVISNLLFKYPQLLPVSLRVNCGCILVSGAAAVLISVDLAQWRSTEPEHMKMEAMELCVLGLEAFLSSILCFWFSKEERGAGPQ